MSNSIGNLKNSGLQGNNFPWQLKMLQGLQAIYDEVKLPLTCVEDSISVCASGTALTTTDDGGIDSLNVHITNAIPLEVNLTCDDAVSICVEGSNVSAGNPLPINGVDLDIRDLDCATDSVSICSDGTPVGSTNPLPVNITFATDSVDVTGSDVTVSNTVDVSATDFDIRDLTFATDTVDVSGSNVNAIVTATNLDIRNLSQLVDTVKIYGSNGANPVATDIAGNIGIQDGGNSITVDSNAAVRTPTVLRTSANSSVLAGAYSISFASVGTVDATVGGQTLKPGETINFDAGGIDNTLGAVVYDSSAVGAELLIITLT